VLGRPDIDAETLAAKHQFPVKKMVARHRANILTPHGLRTCYEARIERDGKAADRPVRRDTPRTRQERVITDRIPAWIPAPATTSSTTCSRRNGVNHQRATCTQRCPRGSAGGRAERTSPPPGTSPRGPHSTVTTAPAAPCAGSTTWSPRPSRPWPGTPDHRLHRPVSAAGSSTRPAGPSGSSSLPPAVSRSKAGEHTITAADPQADDLHQALDHIHGRTSAQIG
jgi:hypothetical protein